MEQIRLNEVALGKAIQRYLQDIGYIVHKLELHCDHSTNEFSAVAMVEKD